MIKANKDTIITTQILRDLCVKNDGEVLPRLKKLESYYKGKNDILKRVMKDPTKPNNKIVSPFANYITDMFVGYFIGEPIAYNSQDEQALEELQMTFNYNDEQDENAELAKDASVYGVAYELMYVDEDGINRFKRVNPKEVIIIESDSLDEEILYGIRYYQGQELGSDQLYTTIEVYSKNDVKIYKSNENYDNLILVDEYPHYFGLVPFAIYKNNDDLIGDFELVISLIDAYDKLASDSLNDFEYFCDAYLALYGMDADADDIKSMKENRVILMDEGTSAEWLTKDVNDTQMENLKKRLEDDIHKFSKCPAMTDENFSSNASGVAMKYKVMGMENVASVKERKFKKGLQRRIELLSNILNLTYGSFDWRAIEITFTRNLPVNVIEVANMINNLRGIVSNETLLLQLPFVEDVAAELQRIEEENSYDTLSLAFDSGSEVNSDGEEELLG